MSEPAPPLAGLLVLDFTALLPGRLATLMLAETGAEVVKVERPGSGDEMRDYHPRWGDDSVNFALLNRGKRSVALNLKDRAQRARLDPLLARTDVVVEQFRPGVMARLGLGYEELSRTDIERPVLPPALVADVAGGACPAFMNILMAMLSRQASGRGCFLDVAITDNLFPFLYWAIGNGLGAGQWPGNGGDLVTGGTPRYRLYATRDARLIAAAPIEQRFWTVFCDLIASIPASATIPATARRIAEIIGGEISTHWRAVFAGRDCCCSVVATVQEGLANPHFAARALFARTLSNHAGASLPALPVAVLPPFRTPRPQAVAPALGADNDALLGATPV